MHTHHHLLQNLRFPSLDMANHPDVGMVLDEGLHKQGVLEEAVDQDSHSNVDAGVGPEMVVHAMQVPVGHCAHHLQNNLWHAIQDRADNTHWEDMAAESKGLHRSYRTGDTICLQVVQNQWALSICHRPSLRRPQALGSVHEHAEVIRSSGDEQACDPDERFVQEDHVGWHPSLRH